MPGWASDLVARWNWLDVALTALVVVLAWVASRIFSFLVERISDRWSRSPGYDLQKCILTSIRRPVSLLILLVGIYFALHRYNFLLLPFLDSLIFIATVALVIHTLTKVMVASLRWYAERIPPEGGGEALAGGLIPIADKVGKLIFLTIGLIVVLDHFDVEIRSILVTLGVGTLAIGLALQDTLANMFGGLTIMLDRPFVVGDRIELSSGETGEVRDIGIRSTRVLTLEGNLLVIPNAMLVKAMMTNHCLPDRRARVIVDVGVGFGTDTERAKGLILEAALEHPKILRPPEPAVGFLSFGESALNLRLICFVADFRDRFVAIDALNSSINSKFRAAGIEIPYPVRKVRFREGEDSPAAPLQPRGE